MDINAFQSNLFTRCTTCDKLDRELHKQLNPEKKRDIFIKKQEHLHRQMYVSTSYSALITKNQPYQVNFFSKPLRHRPCPAIAFFFFTVSMVLSEYQYLTPNPIPPQF